MVLCVVLVQQGGVVPRHAGAGAHLGQPGQPRPQLLPPLPGPGPRRARVARCQRGRSYECELAPDDLGEPGEQVEPEPAGAQGAQREDLAAEARTGAALPYVAGAPPEREGQGPEGDGGGGRDQEGGAEGQVQHPFGRGAGGEAGREVAGPVGEAGEVCGGAGGEVAPGGAGGVRVLPGGGGLGDVRGWGRGRGWRGRPGFGHGFGPGLLPCVPPSLFLLPLLPLLSLLPLLPLPLLLPLVLLPHAPLSRVPHRARPGFGVRWSAWWCA
ncbi:protein of unknown function [Streptomyces sp. KY75]|nr:protein of unknown function [Streptomyces sp. KY75]CAD5975847.1 protein of unknown function [Streptomyces sp. KY70]